MFFSRRKARSFRLRVRLAVEPLEERSLLQGMPLLVTTNADSGEGSLRAAIITANTLTGPTTIDFAIGSGPKTIAVLSPLPAITAPVLLDGTSQPGFSGSPLITLTKSSSATGVTTGLEIDSTGSTIEALMITGFPADGVMVAAGGNNNTIGGTSAGAGNVISGNGGIGILLASKSNVVQGNKIGTDPSGTVAMGNLSGGIALFGALGNTIGGTDAGAGNLISGNEDDGIVAEASTGDFAGMGSDGNLIQGNKIGTNLARTGALPNMGQGIHLLAASNNTIGGTAAGAANLISGNSQSGILLEGSQFSVEGPSVSINNVIEGNQIGIGQQGDALPNALDGVAISDGANDTTIGGTVAGAGNTISGNGRFGVLLGGPGMATFGNIVQGNRIGTNPDGTAPLGNGANGVEIEDLVNAISIGGSIEDNTIGGSATGAGNVISGNAFYGILLSGAEGNLIEGNRIGTDAVGNAAVPNQLDGIYIAGSSLNDIAVNVISGNGRFGIFVLGLSTTTAPMASNGNLFKENTIGLGAGGVTLPNTDDGVALFAGATNNVIGGAELGAGNTISANGRFGVFVNRSTTSGNYIQGNRIGTSTDGTMADGNKLDGIALFDGATFNVIGGTVAGAGNVISGNGRDGIFMDGAGPTNAIEGNLIGTNAAGSAAVGNQGTGVAVAYTPNTFVGGTTSGAGNVISGNIEGVALVGFGTTGNVVQGNFIGTDQAGRAAVANIFYGVDALGGAAGNVIGGTDSGAGNTIAFNGRTGVVIGSSVNDTATTGDSIVSNAIYFNGFQGIDLGNDGPTANTPGGPHSGPNHFQNFPTINSVTPSGGGTAVALSLNSTPGHSFRIEIFADIQGQGRNFLGAGTITTDGNGNGSTTITVAGSLVGIPLQATATDTGTGDTSEFSFPAFSIPVPV